MKLSAKPILEVMPMPAARLEVSHLSVGYGRTQIVSDMSFEVPSGGRLTILGRNGVGKTTLLATLVGLSTRHGGNIKIGDQNVTSLNTSDRARFGLAMFPKRATCSPR
jgi:branched-chain amino acid transport system ATP-binding protein